MATIQGGLVVQIVLDLAAKVVDAAEALDRQTKGGQLANNAAGQWIKMRVSYKDWLIYRSRDNRHSTAVLVKNFNDCLSELTAAMEKVYSY